MWRMIIILFLLLSFLHIFDIISNSFFRAVLCLGAKVWHEMALFHHFSLLIFKLCIKLSLFKHFMNRLWRLNKAWLPSLLLRGIPNILDCIGDSGTRISQNADEEIVVILLVCWFTPIDLFSYHWL